MIYRKKVRDTLKICAPRAWLPLAGASLIILSAAGFAQADSILFQGSAILQAGNGTVVVSGNGTTSGCIIWYNNGTPSSTCPSSGQTGTFTVEGGSTRPFAPGVDGTIQDLNFNTPLPLVDFMQVQNQAGMTIFFDLADIRTNTGPAIGDCSGTPDGSGNNWDSPGVSCTPTNSPFTLTNGLADSSGKIDTVGVAFTVDAWGYRNNSGTNYNSATPYVGIFTTQQATAGTDATDDIDTILTAIASGDSITASWSATFTPIAISTITAAPESATFLLFGAGFMTLGLLKRNPRKS